MSIRFFFELIGDYDSYELYKALKWAKVNVTDMIEHTYVYGTVSPLVLQTVIYICNLFGMIKGGGSMVLKCVAVVDNELQRENLRQCVEILKAKPSVDKNTVTVQVPYGTEQSEKLIELFEQYTRHEISTS